MLSPFRKSFLGPLAVAGLTTLWTITTIGVAAATEPTVQGIALDNHMIDGAMPAGEPSMRILLTAFAMQQDGDDSMQTDLEALEQRLNLDSLDDLKLDLDAIERRLKLDDREPDAMPKDDDAKDDDAQADPSEPDPSEADPSEAESGNAIDLNRNNSRYPRRGDRDGKNGGDAESGIAAGLPKIVAGKFVMPPLAAATIATDEIGNGRRPNTFRSAAETPRIALPESGLDRRIAWQPMVRCWAPSGNFSHPLYFEDRMLERHGHDRWGYAQPLVSGARFVTQAAMLPYLASIEHPCDCRYAMGNFRSGNCTPAYFQRPPWDREAIVAQSIATAGTFWIFP